MEFLGIIDFNIFLRLAISFFCGFALGFEREITGKFAGLRTHILVCVGACVFTILSIYGFKFNLVDGFNGTNDPARVAAQIITGIGFIGAGTVMRHGTTVSGITTAATLWVGAAVGMAAGCGMNFLALVTTLSTLVVLIAIRHFEKRFLSRKYMGAKPYEVCFSCNLSNYEKYEKLIGEKFSKILSFKKDNNGKDLCCVRFTALTTQKIDAIQKMFKESSALEIKETSY